MGRVWRNRWWLRYASGSLAVSLLLLAIPVAAAASISRARHAGKSGATVSGTVRGAVTSGGITGLDPNRWYFALTWEMANALCTTLIRYATKPGVASTNLVPGTANLPVISHHGLEYTFTMRQGARFSDGKPITPADIKYTILRLMNPKVDSGTGVFFAKVIGASNYMAGKSSTVSGITTTSHSISFHLSSASGAFEYAAALLTTCPVPVGTPMKPLTTGSLLEKYASGPYKIQSYSPGRSLVFVYNHNYNRALGNRGHVAKIDFSIGVDSHAAVEEIQAGQLDFNTTNIDTATIIRLSHDPTLHSQVHDSVRDAIFYIFLNTQVAPFTNVDVRKAINYAITRTDILKQWGGSLAGNLTDQLTPPALPDYKKISLYPNTSDLSKAKHLMAESGVKTPVTMQLRVVDTEPGLVTMGDVIKSNLAPLGITVDVVGSPNSVNYSYITNYKSHTASGIEEWSATFPDDYSVIGVQFNPAISLSSQHSHRRHRRRAPHGSRIGRSSTGVSWLKRPPLHRCSIQSGSTSYRPG
jgi:peptide/nickel transport system substrate-binding protein